MDRREEIMAELDRQRRVAKSLFNQAKAANRDFTEAEKDQFDAAIATCRQIGAELKAMAPEINPTVHLDRRLTQERNTPVCSKVCWECIDELAAELETCVDPNRQAGIEIEIEAWRAEWAAATGLEEAVRESAKLRHQIA